MTVINRYIIKMIAQTFLGTLAALTLVVWATQVLRELDLITSKGQSFFFFLEVAVYLIPMLVLIIMPIALLVAVMQVLNKLSNDSELIVMTAAGLSPRQFMTPFLKIVAIVMIVVSVFALYLTPSAIRQLRILGTKAQSNIIALVVKPGRFTQLQPNLTFHIRERKSSGELKGILIHDTRDSVLHLTYIAEEGQVSESGEESYLILEKGTMQRKNVQHNDVALIAFDKYAFDLSQFSVKGEAQFRPSEKRLSELINPDPKDPIFQKLPGRFRQEMHDRIVAPLYPLAFTLIALAFLREAKTTRQGRTGASIATIISVISLKIMGLAASSMSIQSFNGVLLMYIIPIAAIFIFGGAAFGYYALKTPDKLTYFIAVKRRKIFNAIKAG